MADISIGGGEDEDRVVLLPVDAAVADVECGCCMVVDDDSTGVRFMALVVCCERREAVLLLWCRMHTRAERYDNIASCRLRCEAEGRVCAENGDAMQCMTRWGVLNLLVLCAL